MVTWLFYLEREVYMQIITTKVLFPFIAFFIGFGVMLLIAFPALAMPEPATITLLGLGLLGIVGASRKKF